jgi:hypothetical protein
VPPGPARSRTGRDNDDVRIECGDGAGVRGLPEAHINAVGVELAGEPFEIKPPALAPAP